MKIDFDAPPIGGMLESIRRTHLVLIPSYNSGPKLIETVRAARRYWAPVWVVIDGSTDGSAAALAPLAAGDPDLRLLSLPENQGKGAAILHGVRLAEREGFTHVLTMDADGQHPAALIPHFIAASRAEPDALILGRPVFDDSAPRIRVLGRKLSNWWTGIETLWIGRFDSLFGFRVYPVADLRAVMEESRWMRRFDFDAEAAVRLCWRGFRPVSLPAPVRYFTPQQGGVSHFRYVRDNILLSWMHLRLVAGFGQRLPSLLAKRVRPSRH
ncbi:MAG TPA: glycosyltransferase family 2 protein [Aliidongia sp.]|nr:glycosyltransferase family 2 protein [Aliidongia sp.]